MEENVGNLETPVVEEQQIEVKTDNVRTKTPSEIRKDVQE